MDVDMLTIAVFASGLGSNFRAILNAINDGRIHNASVAVVISNNSNAGALVIAQEWGITAVHLSRKQFSSENELTTATLQILERYGVNLVVLAGYMKKIDSSIIERYKNRILNIHPALLPAFGGKGMFGPHVHNAVIAQGAKVSGATVHIVDEEYDRGPIILQREVAVAPDDTPETLAAKVKNVEHELYPEAIRLFAEDQVRIDGQHVTILTAR